MPYRALAKVLVAMRFVLLCVCVVEEMIVDDAVRHNEIVVIFTFNSGAETVDFHLVVVPFVAGVLITTDTMKKGIIRASNTKLEQYCEAYLIRYLLLTSISW